MTRRCSHCSNNGHNSRTCPTRGGPTTNPIGPGNGPSAGPSGGGVRIFGVSLTENNNGSSIMKKSASMGNLIMGMTTNDTDHDPVSVDGYLSDDPNLASNPRSLRKKGKPWTEEEHRRFLAGLQKLGKGDWRGIARNYVVSKTPTQVASHAQKYFIRQSNVTRRKRRSSLFDMVPDTVTEEPETLPEEQLLSLPPVPKESENTSLPSLDLSLSTESELMESTSTEKVKQSNDVQALPVNSIPSFFIPISYPPFWAQPTIRPEDSIKGETSHHMVLKPTPVLGKEAVNVDELVRMSQLNLSETENNRLVGPPQLSLNVLGNPYRQSAFHASGL